MGSLRIFLVVLGVLYFVGCNSPVFQQWAADRMGYTTKSGYLDSYDLNVVNTALHREGYNDLTAISGAFKNTWENGKLIGYILANCEIQGGGVAETHLRFEDDITNYRILQIKRLSKSK